MNMNPDKNFFKNDQDPWREGILLERQASHQWSLEEGIEYVTCKDNALILGDACKVNSKYLIDEIGFGHVDNVDSSPMISDDYYQSDKMTTYETSFEEFDYPENMYDLIHGKSITFIDKNCAPEILQKIANSLRSDGILSSVWNLSDNTLADGRWKIDYIKKLLANMGLSEISSVEVKKPFHDLGGNPGTTHFLKVLMKKD